MVLKDNKRLSIEDEQRHISHKHPRRLDYTVLEGSVPFNLPEKPSTSVDEGRINLNIFQCNARVENLTSAELSLVAEDKEFDSHPFGSISGLSSFASVTSEEEMISEPTLRVSFSPGFRDHVPSSWSGPDMMFSSLIDHFPRKPVSIGPDHQVDIPVWEIDDDHKVSGSLCKLAQYGSQLDSVVSYPPSLPSHLALKECNWLAGSCDIPMPALGSNVCNDEKIGRGRAACTCFDEGSIRCVRQHVKENREKLRGMLGQEQFLELGFCEMGEDISKKWREVEQQLFQEVVFSNPASLGRNFWDHLLLVFPSRTKKDLVSYYFNVFVLRKRAEQNRLDPLSIDSDNDELQGSDDGDEFAFAEEDSIVGSPVVYQANTFDDGAVFKNAYNEDDDRDGDDGDRDGGGLGYSAGDEDGQPNYALELQGSGSKSSPHKPFGHSSSAVTKCIDSTDLQSISVEQDAQDEFCTSYKCLHGRIVSSRPSNSVVIQDEKFENDRKIVNGEYGACLGYIGGHGFLPEAFEVWDFGFVPRTNNRIDFLPTCRMIEEVFRNELWND